MNEPYFLGNGLAKPMPLRQLRDSFVNCMDCSSESIICGCDDRRILTLRLSGVDDCSVVDQINDLDVTHISMSDEFTFCLVNVDDSTSREMFFQQPEYMPHHQSLNFVLTYIKNIPSDTTPHFLRTDSLDSLNL